MIKTITKTKIFGTVQVPPSKSDSQRAILAASLSKDTTVLYNVGKSNDELSMLSNCAILGADIVKLDDGKYSITGIRQFPEEAELNVGESGLGLRLITAVCAAHEGTFVINGEGSILKRPQVFFEDHLTQLGVQVESNNGFLPLKIKGPLIGGKLVVDGSMSSQFLSGLLMALPLIKADTNLTVKNLKSVPYVKMTLETIKTFGIEIDNKSFEEFYIKGNQEYTSSKYAIESDWSGASFWLVASALGHDVKVLGLTLDSQQADLELLNALTIANCGVVADETGIRINGSNRKAFSFDATHCPDLFPALVAFASFCEGKSKILGVRRLKNKESDRGEVLKEEFGKLGVTIELDDDLMVIEGSSSMKSTKVNAHNDHRIAMCLAIAAINLEGEMEITGAESVKKSYPDFWNHLEALITP